MKAVQVEEAGQHEEGPVEIARIDKIRHLLNVCKEEVYRISNILYQNRRFETLEFLSTISYVSHTLDLCIQDVKNNSDLPPMYLVKSMDLVERVKSLLVEEYAKLAKLLSSGRLMRLVSSNRVRKELEMHNILLHTIVQKLEAKYQKSQLQRIDNSVGGFYEKLKLEHHDLIQDRHARQFWESNFLHSLLVSWDKFLLALKELFPDISGKDLKNLKYIMDNCDTGHVALYRFSQFVIGFGPFQECLKKVRSTMNATWFQGYLSADEAAKLLHSAIPGSFLVRFRSSNAGDLAIAYVDDEKCVRHTKIEADGNHLIVCQQDIESGEDVLRQFDSLEELVNNYKANLRHPFSTTLSKSRVFHGDLTGEEANSMLKERAPGSYLIRFSDQSSGCFVVAYVNAESKISEGTMEPLGNDRFRLTLDGQLKSTVYSSLDALIQENSDILKCAVPSGTLKVEAFIESIFQESDERSADHLDDSDTAKEDVKAIAEPSESAQQQELYDNEEFELEEIDQIFDCSAAYLEFLRRQEGRDFAIVPCKTFHFAGGDLPITNVEGLSSPDFQPTGNNNIYGSLIISSELPKKKKRISKVFSDAHLSASSHIEHSISTKSDRSLSINFEVSASSRTRSMSNLASSFSSFQPRSSISVAHTEQIVSMIFDEEK